MKDSGVLGMKENPNTHGALVASVGEQLSQQKAVMELAVNEHLTQEILATLLSGQAANSIEPQLGAEKDTGAQVTQQGLSEVLETELVDGGIETAAANTGGEWIRTAVDMAQLPQGAGYIPSDTDLGLPGTEDMKADSAIRQVNIDHREADNKDRQADSECNQVDSKDKQTSIENTTVDSEVRHASVDGKETNTEATVTCLDTSTDVLAAGEDVETVTPEPVSLPVITVTPSTSSNDSKTPGQAETVEDNDPVISTKDADLLKKFLLTKYKDLLTTEAVSKTSPQMKFDSIAIPLMIREDIEKQIAEKKTSEQKSRVHDPDNEPRAIDTYEEVFYKAGELQEDIYVLGKAGVGKSLFSWLLVHSWCKVQEHGPTSDTDEMLAKFDFVFRVSCRFAASSDSISDMVVKQLCGDLPVDKTVVEQILASSSKRCLIVVDGLDEWAASAAEMASPVQSGVPARDGLRNCVVLITSGPVRVETLYKGLGYSCRVLEIVSLDKEDVLDMIEHLLTSLNDPYANVAVDFLWEEIKRLNLQEVAKLPLMLTNMIVTWHENGHRMETSMCVNYAGMLESLIRRTDLTPDLKAASETELSGCPNERFPPCFATRKLCKKYWSLILDLAALAFDSLLAQQREILVFNKPDLVNVLSEKDLDACLKFGILVQSEVALESCEPGVSISFLHKNFQEFLAALHMSRDNSSQCFEKFKERCKTVADVIERGLITSSLCGFDPDRGSQLCQYLVSLTEHDCGVEDYRHSADCLYPFSRLHFPAVTVVQVEELLLASMLEARHNLESTVADTVSSTKPQEATQQVSASEPHTVGKKKHAFNKFYKFFHGKHHNSNQTVSHTPKAPPPAPKRIGVDAKEKLSKMYLIPDVYVDKDLSSDACSYLYKQATSHSSTLTSLVFSGETETPARVLLALGDMSQLERLHITSSLQQVERDVKYICKILPKFQRLKSLGFQVTKYRQLPVPGHLIHSLLTALNCLPCLTSLHLGFVTTATEVTGKAKTKKRKSVKSATVTTTSQEEGQLPADLTSLSLSSVSFPANMHPLFPSSMPHMTTLDMKGVRLSHTQIQQFCECVKNSPSLQKMSLSGLFCSTCTNGICDYNLDLSGLSELQTLDLEYLDVHKVTLGSSKVTSVRLWELSTPGAVGTVLAGLPQSEGLTSLAVSDCSLSPSDIDALVDILNRCQKLEELELRNIQCDTQGITATNMPQLREIDMYRVKMSASSWSQFIHTLPLPAHELDVLLRDCNVDKQTENEISACPFYRGTYRSETDIEFQILPRN